MLLLVFTYLNCVKMLQQTADIKPIQYNDVLFMAMYMVKHVKKTAWKNKMLYRYNKKNILKSGATVNFVYFCY